jgi:anhydro-N-acetylmuramic acid kinase
VTQRLFIGLMSGTSLDGIDGVLADFSGEPRVLAQASQPMPSDLREQFLRLNSSDRDELHRGALAANALTQLYAQTVHDLLAQAQRLGIDASAISAIGAHGQTVRHQPQTGGTSGYTWQLHNPALLAELTGLDVVADFRNADLAAGGQGAPLVPGFHAALWADGQTVRAVLNIGGISNLTLLAPNQPVMGFDCGPGNALMDHWCERHTGQAFDADGRWAASGRVRPDILERLLDEPFFAQAPPKSTGRDLFHPTRPGRAGCAATRCAGHPDGPDGAGLRRRFKALSALGSGTARVWRRRAQLRIDAPVARPTAWRAGTRQRRTGPSSHAGRGLRLCLAGLVLVRTPAGQPA